MIYVKRFIAAVLPAFIMCFIFSGCSKKSVEPVRGEILKTGNGYSVSFIVKNSTGGTVSGLSIKIRTFSEGGKEADSGEAAYPIEISDGAEATLTFETEKKCTSAEAVSCTYKDESGRECTAGFDGTLKAELKEKAVSDVLTREALAENIIRDIKSRFLAEGTYSYGEYDAEKNHLIIVSRYTQSYDVCLALYEKEPDMWTSLADGIVSMSETCLEEFRDNNFDDVSVSVGVMSSDEEMMFSATDGQLTDSLGS